ncbi:MAG TPA: hypothetical protein VGA06_02725 [Candidatus Paceibacterota bacterium]|jgi:hypothetical protein
MQVLPDFLLLLLHLIVPGIAAEQQISEPGLSYESYRHEELHQYYQKLFSQGKCNCKTGQCRPTTYRLDSSSPSGVEVQIDGTWHDPPPESLLHKNQIPPELWHYDAHVCAYPNNNGGYVIECTVINSGV